MKKELMVLLSLFSAVIPTMYGASKTMDVVEIEGVEIDPEEVKIALVEIAKEHPQLKTVAEHARKHLRKGLAKYAIKQRMQEICEQVHAMSHEERRALFKKLARRYPRLAHKLQRVAKKHGKPLVTEEEEVSILPIDMVEE